MVEMGASWLLRVRVLMDGWMDGWVDGWTTVQGPTGSESGNPVRNSGEIGSLTEANSLRLSRLGGGTKKNRLNSRTMDRG